MTPLILSGSGVTPAVTLTGAAGLVPSYAVNLSAGAYLSYVIEVTLDDLVGGAFPTPGNWQSLNQPFVVTTSSIGGFPFLIRGARARITSWTSGSLNFQVAQ